MCGDDWQSIYGFNGSDIRFTFDFEKVLEKHQELIWIKVLDLLNLF